ncbi:beta-microseminoprotein [Talpa occidentalis]|uniref:beta-microseminoprotein n=1 Tax=Talpa occidentalis TaxID=50954 RepID=UPI00188FDEFB|nr:beta-microseminoprotein [Talpa occidentalis]
MLQNTLLGSLLVLGTFMTLCNAECFLMPQENMGSDECRDVDGGIHPINTSWKTKDCQKCTCYRNGISCCGIAAIPVGFDERKCKKIFNKQECRFKVVHRINPGKTCEVGEWVQ